MSRVYFHSPSGQVDVSGRVRFQGDVYSRDFTRGLLDLANKPSLSGHKLGEWFLGRVRVRSSRQVVPLVPPGASEQDLRFAVSAALGGGGFGEVTFFEHDGQEHEVWSLCMNTGLRAFDDPLRLSIRLHGQCELHCWVDGRNREWLAKIVEAGLAAGVYNAEDRWGPVVAFLRSRADEPVVTSYSVTEPFPNLESVGLSYQEEREAENESAWSKLTNEERWSRGMAWLRGKHGGLELKPDDFQSYFFNTGMDAFQVRKIWRDTTDEYGRPK